MTYAQPEQLSPAHQVMKDEIDNLQKRLGDKQQFFAEQLCPHKVGDVFVSKNGYRARVTKIRYSFLRPYYQVYGSILRTNGTTVPKEIHLYEGDGSWRKE